MGHHAFTVDEANEMLPEVRAALDQIHSLRDVARSKMAGRRRITSGQMKQLARLDDPARHEDSALDF